MRTRSFQRDLCWLIISSFSRRRGRGELSASPLASRLCLLRKPAKGAVRKRARWETRRHLLTVGRQRLDRMRGLPPPGGNSGTSDSSWTHFPLGGLQAPPSSSLSGDSWGPEHSAGVGLGPATNKPQFLPGLSLHTFGQRSHRHQ